jgi:hypothetical protein
MTVMAVDPLTEIADTIKELCDQYSHTEKYEIWTKARHRRQLQHHSWHAPLIVQLQQAAGIRRAGDPVRPGRHGKPAPAAPANLDALDRLQAIEIGTATWRARLGQKPLHEGLFGDLRTLVGAAAAAEPHDRRQLAADIDRWRLWCLTLGGWRARAWRPDAPCPHCDTRQGEKQGLRVRLDRSTACCLSCGAAWGPYTVGILADHVRKWKESNP